MCDTRFTPPRGGDMESNKKIKKESSKDVVEESLNPLEEFGHPEENELEKAWNESFTEEEVEVSSSITVGQAINYTAQPEYIIGTHDWKNGKPSDYEIFEDDLWVHMLRFIHHRLTAAKGTSCLINIRTMSRWITEQANIKSMWAVEKAALKVFMERFGVSDVVDEEPEKRGWKKLRGTTEFWGTLGGRGSEGKKRLARLYQVIKPTKLMKYIEGEINLEQYG